MIVSVAKSKISGDITSIPSKSYAHRIAICNFLAGQEPVGKCGGFTSKDITATEESLKRVKNGEHTVDCGESGSTLRFLLPLLAVLGGRYTLIGHGKLLERPNDELFSVLESHGVKVEKGDGIVIDGKLTAGEFCLRGDISSQYVSGLLMALPVLEGDSEIRLSTPLVSSSYVDITLEVLSSYGIKVDKTDYGFSIKGNQKYFGNVLPEGDWSNSAFFLVLGAIAGDITVYGLNEKSVQGDRKIIDILNLAGADVKISTNSVGVKKSNLKAFTFDGDVCPDLVPIASVLASKADGVSKIYNVNRLKIKESDRIASTIKMLSSFGIKADYDGENLIVYGGSAKCGVVDSFNDHRIAMSSAVLGVTVEGQSKILLAESVEKSYPTFYEDLKKVGGRVENV